MFSRLAFAAALAPLATAFQVTVTSNCPFPVYGWNVVNSYGSGSPTFTLSSGKSWSTPFDSRSNGGGPSIKLKLNDNIFDGGQIEQIEYKMAGSTLFYDLSEINGAPFTGHGITMDTDNGGCPKVTCSASEAVCNQAYLHPDDLRTLACPGGANINVVLCGGGAGSAPAPAPAPPAPKPKPTTLAPAPKPSVTAAPAAPQQQGGNFLQEGSDGKVKVVVATTVIPVTVTQHVKGPAPTQAKREAHLNEHAHRKSRIMGRHAH